MRSIMLTTLAFMTLVSNKCIASSSKINKTLEEHGDKIKTIEKTIIEQSTQIKSIDGYIANHISIISWISGISISAVGLIFAISTIVNISKNKQILKEADDSLKKCKSALDECTDIRTQHEIKLNDLYTILSNELQEHANSKRRVLHDYTYLLRLDTLLIEGKYDNDEIYRLLTPLATNPHKEYLATFNKIIKLNLSDEITQMATNAHTAVSYS